MKKFEKLSDAELVSRFSTGENTELILETLISRHRKRIYTYILLIVKKDEIAKDIFQETFVKVISLMKTGKYTENGKFVSWVLRIAHNFIIDHFRKEKLYNSFNEGKYQEEEPISLYFNTVEFNKNEIVEIISLLSEIYRTIGGDGLIIKGMKSFKYVNELQPAEF